MRLVLWHHSWVKMYDLALTIAIKLKGNSGAAGSGRFFLELLSGLEDWRKNSRETCPSDGITGRFPLNHRSIETICNLGK